MKRVIVLANLLLIGFNTNVFAGEWVGTNLLTSNWRQTSEPIVQYPWQISSSPRFWYLGVGMATLQQDVQIETGKRYRVSGFGKAVYSIGSFVGANLIYINLSSTGIGSTGNWPQLLTNDGDYSDEPFSYREVEGIATNSLTTFEIYADTDRHGSPPGWGEFNTVQLNKVVYNPQIAIYEEDVAITPTFFSNNFGISTAHLNLQDLSSPDSPTNWWIDWGDGNQSVMPTLNSIIEHTYIITAGIGQTWTATLYGENQVGSITDTVSIAVVPEPATLLLLSLGGLLLRKNSK